MAYVTLSIRRGSDDLFWNGASWGSGFAPLSVTEIDAINEPGFYRYVLSSAANTQADTYRFRAQFSNSLYPQASGESYEEHVSRVTNVVVVEGEPSI